jgi:hypothetical protein
MKMENETYGDVVKEICEVVNGTRGMVCISKARAKRVGRPHSDFLKCVKAGGLEIDIHGKYGWTAYRAEGSNEEIRRRLAR